MDSVMSAKGEGKIKEKGRKGKREVEKGVRGGE